MSEDRTVLVEYLEYVGDQEAFPAGLIRNYLVFDGTVVGVPLGSLLSVTMMWPAIVDHEDGTREVAFQLFLPEHRRCEQLQEAWVGMDEGWSMCLDQKQVKQPSSTCVTSHRVICVPYYIRHKYLTNRAMDSHT
jgi:hypothetical protein